MAIACVRCGRADGTLRVVYFRWVVSVLILSFRRPAGGVLCAGCRRITNFTSSLLTLLAGWWGLPWGLIWTPQALFMNLRGGIQPAGANSVLLAALSTQLRDQGQGIAGSEAFNAALALHPEAAREAAAQPTQAGTAIAGLSTARATKRDDVLRLAGSAAILLLVASAFTGILPGGAGSADLVFEGPPASYSGGTVHVTGSARNISQRTADAVWLEVIVTDGTTGREVTRAKKPASAPLSDVSIPPQGSVPFDVTIQLGSSAPKSVGVEQLLHWRRR